ncbi:MAG TPA: prephenate dehydrogenase dimerization domain-containing protein [Candidatus Eisenbacteria bacterium]|nr:prephenate dehydrogenase dimerization domain-containing protein [Candidatus Eisenbacteria bacterium]
MTTAREHTRGERVLILGSSPAAAALGRALRLAGARVEDAGVDAVTDVPLDPSITLILLALPIRDVPQALARIGPALPEGAVLVDLAPLMLPSATAVRGVPGLAERFVSAHPILEDAADRSAGHATGSGAGAPDPVAGATVFLGAPLAAGSPAARVARLLESLGARTEAIAPALHDALVALTHHLPILSAAALTRALRRTGSLTRAVAPGAGTALADATRPASGRSDLAAEVLLLSAPKLLPALEILEREVRRLRHALEAGGDELRTLLEEAREFRRELVA